MRSIQGTPVGMGSVTLSLQEVTDRPYRYKRRPEWRDDDPSTWNSGSEDAGSDSESSHERHERRLRQYQQILAADPCRLSSREIAARMQVAVRTVSGYARKLAGQGWAPPGCGSCGDDSAGRYCPAGGTAAAVRAGTETRTGEAV